MWSTRALIARHKLAAAGALAVVLLLLAFGAAAILTSSSLVVTDSTTCSTWASANQTQQKAYALHYIREYGQLPGGGTAPARVVTAVNIGCTQAFTNDAADTATVLAAIRQQ